MTTNHIIVDIGLTMNQSTTPPSHSMEELVVQFTQMRDVHHDPATFAALYVFLNTLAQTVNKTIIAANNPAVLNSSNSNDYLRIFLYVSGFGEEKRTIMDISKHFRNPVFSIIPTEKYSFVYCEIPRRKFNSVWSFSVFTNSMNSWTWLILCVDAVAVGLLAFSKVDKFSPAILPTFSLLLSIATISSRMKREKSYLFVLWMFVCAILVNFYTGGVTSTVIKPVGDDSLTRMEHLAERNFTLVYPVNVILSAIKDIAGLNSSSARALKKLSAGAICKSVINSELFDSLLENERMTMVSVWPLTLFAQTVISRRILRGNVSMKDKKKKCYVGKELIPGPTSFIAFTPPGHVELARKFQSLVETGIFYYWVAEQFALAHSRRVQDRNRIKSSISIVDENGGNNEVVQLRMEGKMVTVFGLWGVCLCISGVFLACEKILQGVINLVQCYHYYYYVIMN